MNTNHNHKPERVAHMDPNRREIITDRTKVWYQHGYSPTYIAKTLGVAEHDVRRILGLEQIPEQQMNPEFIEPKEK